MVITLAVAQILAKQNCSVCNVSFRDKESFENHLNDVHPEENDFKLIESAFSKKLLVYRRNIRKKAADTLCLWSVFNNFKSLCKRISSADFPVFRTNICMYGVFEKPDVDDHETEIFVLKSTHFVVKPYTKLRRIWTAIIKEFDDPIEDLLMEGSGYSLTEVLKLHVEVAEVKALKYSCQEPELKADIATDAVEGKNI